MLTSNKRHVFKRRHVSYNQQVDYHSYAGYHQIEKVTLVCCWVHARKKFNDALNALPKKTGPIRSTIFDLSL
ncbi:IS66 family transposase [Sporolactobacillus sp. CQH2019]|uniref:IS66 family transposase n=1 Tax=Sporolactobacillus sp. CQH2019 TaxID=3023512 RepID=UPI0030833EBC